MMVNTDVSDRPAGLGRALSSEGLTAADLEVLKARLSVAVIHGGDKAAPGAVLHQTHNPRAWKSYRPVAEDIAGALRELGFAKVHLLAEGMGLAEALRRERIDLAWLNSGGVQGYNPVCHLPAMMEMLGLPYVGHNPLLASTLDNKHAFKRELETCGLPTARYMTWDGTRGPFLPAINSRFQAVFGDYDGPFVVKPVSGRASLNVEVVESLRDLPKRVDALFAVTANLVLIEPFLPGREFVVAVCGPLVSRQRRLLRKGTPFVFSICERLLGAEERIFTSMDVTPITHDRVRPLDAVAEPELVEELEALARQTYLDFNLETLVRLDLRHDAEGRLQILEANPKPDLARPEGDRLPLVCSGLAAEGMDYADLILSQIANRLDFLMRHRADTIGHILERLGSAQ